MKKNKEEAARNHKKKLPKFVVNDNANAFI